MKTPTTTSDAEAIKKLIEECLKFPDYPPALNVDWESHNFREGDYERWYPKTPLSSGGTSCSRTRLASSPDLTIWRESDRL